MSNISIYSLSIIYNQYNLKRQLARKDNLGNKIIYLKDVCYLDKEQFKFFLENPIEIDFFCFEKLNDYNQNLLIKKFQSESKFMSIFSQNAFENFLSLLTSDNSLITSFFKNKTNELNYWKNNITLNFQSEIDKKYYLKQLWNFILLNHGFSHQQYCFEHVLYFKLFLLNVLLNNDYKLNTSDYNQLILSLENDLNYYRAIEYNKIELNHNNLIMQYCYDLIDELNCLFENKFLFYEFLYNDNILKRHNHGDNRLNIIYDFVDENLDCELDVEHFVHNVIKLRSTYCIIVFPSYAYQYITINNINNLIEKFVFLRKLFKNRLHVEFRVANLLLEDFNDLTNKEQLLDNYHIYKYLSSVVVELINSKLNSLYDLTKNEIFNFEYHMYNDIQLLEPEKRKKLISSEIYLVDETSYLYLNYVKDLNYFKI